MSRLSHTLKRTLDELQQTAAGLERRAELPAMSIKNIFNGSHPRSDRFDRLLQAIPSLTHRTELLIAYIVDDCPAAFAAGVGAVLRNHLNPWLQARQASPDTATLASRILVAMALRLDAGDTLLAGWLADTGRLLTNAHLPANDPAP